METNKLSIRCKDTLLFLGFILLAFACQMHCAVHGFDISDEGYVMSLYQNFGKDISMCRGGEGYPLSCIIGGFLYSLNPAGGLLWLRFCGVALVTVMFAITWIALKKEVSSPMLIAGLTCVTFVITSDPKPLGYNNISAFFALISLLFLLRGVSKGSLPLILAGGFVAALGFYARIPNLAFATFLILPFLKTGISKRSFLEAIVAGTGYLAGLLVGWQIMKSAGADGLIIDFFKGLGSTLEGESTHSASFMLKTIALNYLEAAAALVIFISCIILTSLSLRRKWLYPLIVVILGLLYFLLYIHSRDLGESETALFNAIGLGGCILMAIRDKESRVLAAAALLMLLVCPLGSDRGFKTFWPGIMLALPLGLEAIKSFLEESHIPHFKPAFIIIVSAVCFLTFLKTEKRAYYDMGWRPAKTYSIKSKYAKGIYTTQKRAQVTNALLEELEALGVKEGDTLLVYSCSPMTYFLTGTVPYAGVSWPCVEYGQKYVNSLTEALEAGRLPKFVILQYFWGISSGKEWKGGEYGLVGGEKDYTIATARMNTAVTDLIEDNGYGPVWCDDYYEIFAPGKPQPSEWKWDKFPATTFQYR